MENKKALIAGINGQDGSYLAEFLLSKGYEVWGTIKRNSVSETQSTRIEHLRSKDLIHLEYADLTDMSSLVRVLSHLQPDEVYNLAAQSHVRISFDQPIYTSNVTGIGTLNLLEAIRMVSPKSKMYQASSSEMFGNMIDADGYQRETTHMNPVSPYGCAKVFSYNICRNYRNSYNMKIWNGIMFNHECVSEITPIITRNSLTGVIDISNIEDIVAVNENGNDKQQWELYGMDIWDGTEFVELQAITATKRDNKNDDFKCVATNTRNGLVITTKHHNLLDKNSKKIKFKETKINDELLHGDLPINEYETFVSLNEAKMLGLFVSDGYTRNGSGKFTNNDAGIRDLFTKLWEETSLGTTKDLGEKITEYGKNHQLGINGNPNYLRLIESEIYTKSRFKRVPQRILNSNIEIQEAFLDGYNMGDGLKKNKCIYKFKNFKTNSMVLGQGLIFLINKVTGQDFTLNIENGQYYSINLLSNTKYSKSKNIDKEKAILELIEDGYSQRKISEKTGIGRNFIRNKQNGVEISNIHHLKKENNIIKKQSDIYKQPKWVFDLSTSSGKFIGGIGKLVISNSPRRGTNFVTNKVVKAAVKIKLGMQSDLHLGNLDATRDWGHAKDYVEAMWLMLQTDTPDDYVCATGISHSVRDLCEYTFSKLGLKYEDYVKMDEKHMRPEELDILKGDSTKLRKAINWVPKYTFETMLDEMIDYWVDFYKKNPNVDN